MNIDNINNKEEKYLTTLGGIFQIDKSSGRVVITVNCGERSKKLIDVIVEIVPNNIISPSTEADNKYS